MHASGYNAVPSITFSQSWSTFAGSVSSLLVKLHSITDDKSPLLVFDTFDYLSIKCVFYPWNFTYFVSKTSSCSYWSSLSILQPFRPTHIISWAISNLIKMWTLSLSLSWLIQSAFHHLNRKTSDTLKGKIRYLFIWPWLSLQLYSSLFFLYRGGQK